MIVQSQVGTLKYISIYPKSIRTNTLHQNSFSLHMNGHLVFVEIDCKSIYGKGLEQIGPARLALSTYIATA